MKKGIITILLMLTLTILWAQVPSQSWKELKQHNEAPEWFRDAKFGIYAHWGVYSVPAYWDEWYPRYMHWIGHDVYKHHIKTYGDHSQFGYHDFIPMFTAENFNAKEWVDVFVRSGAQFAGPVAEHHDGFSMWPSKVNPWNAGAMGPKRDIVGELEKEIRKTDLKFMVSLHHALNSIFFRNNPAWKTSNINDKYAQLYGNLPPYQFFSNWTEKADEVLYNYKPDMIWFDSDLVLVPDQRKRQFLTNYFEDAKKDGRDVVVTCKNDQVTQEVCVKDFEKGRMDKMTSRPWLTDDTISYGSWCYTDGLKIKTSSEILHVLCDIISKNGILLLNISPKADGTIPEDQKNVLAEIGDWLKLNGEAVYGTRTFFDYGQGPTEMGTGGHFVSTKIKYTAQDIRYTVKGNNIYAILLGVPEVGEKTVFKVFAENESANALKIENISIIGIPEAVEWKTTEAGLEVKAPKILAAKSAVVYKIETNPKKTLQN